MMKGERKKVGQRDFTHPYLCGCGNQTGFSGLLQFLPVLLTNAFKTQQSWLHNKLMTPDVVVVWLELMS